jgi:hypothetical protein
VIVSRRAVVMIRVIVPNVLVDVQRRRHGRRHGQGLNEHESDEPAHEDSLLRSAERASGSRDALNTSRHGISSANRASGRACIRNDQSSSWSRKRDRSIASAMAL